MLKFLNVSVSYGAIQALSDVDIQVRRGELTVLLGANGSGKTTLIRALAGLVPIDNGRIECNGKPLSDSAENRWRDGIAIVPEGRQLWSGLTVAEHLTLAAYPQLEGWQKFRRRLTPALQQVVDEVVEDFPVLSRNYLRRAETMSGGEQQMLALARALIARPKLLALDEPSVGLAPLVVSELFNRLRQSAVNGLTVLLVEQNAQSALDVADYGYVLEHGRVVASGKPDALRLSKELQEAYLGVRGGEIG